MKQVLQLRLGQHLTMTPQLQQAIRLLQLSAMDLREEIQEALDSNPMLEVDDGVAEGDVGSPNGQEYGPEAPSPGAAEETPARELEEQVASFDPDGPEEMPVDSVGDDIYVTSLSGGASSDSDGRDLEGQDASAETLRDHLVWQMEMTHFSDRDRALALAIIDSIDERGYLSSSIEDIYEGLVADLPDLEVEEVLTVLRRVQHFDPVGVGARDLRECLLIQLQFCPEDTPWLAKARELVADHLDLFARREFAQITRRLKCTQQELQQIVAVVQSLNPHPGNAIADSRPEYIVPDVIVTREKNSWRVELNPEALPRVRINPAYAGLVRRADSSSDNTYMRNQLQEARWFIKSLQSRNETLLKVATCIVERQRGFLEHGEEAMKALVLHDVAEAVNMHESTISRVTTQKYMHTPRGIFELKYFFSSHVSTDGGGECSATAIRAFIKKLVAAEDHARPLSDSKIAQLLKQQGINVARRTIAKYREALSIPSSSERKRLV
jgi:RNA polymerase sigma-54 factor